MRWEKLGLVYEPRGDLWWARSHAMTPTPCKLPGGDIRVYITCCDDTGIGRIGYVDLSSNDPTNVINICPEPILDIGIPGTFDENGVLACAHVACGGREMLYYVGFEQGTKIRYRIFTGLSTSTKDAPGFQKYGRVPILDRSDSELFFRCGPCVLLEDKFRMWYVAGSRWETIGNTDRPIYEIKYLESEDGIHWPGEGQYCIRAENDEEHGFGRPYVVRASDGSYEMYYSVRRRDLASYRLGYATSYDGLTWERKDQLLGLDVSNKGWDSEMICYSAIIDLDGQTYMLYNGNNFGETGFGIAALLS